MGGSASKTVKARANAITDADIDVALTMKPISYELFFDDEDKYVGYRMKMVRDDMYELSNYGKYYPKKGGVRMETPETPMMFVYDGYLYKKHPKQTKTGNLKYDRQILPVLEEEEAEEEEEEQEEEEEEEEVVEECDVPPAKKTKSKQRVIYLSIHMSFPLFDITFSQIGSCCRRFFAN